MIMSAFFWRGICFCVRGWQKIEAPQFAPHGWRRHYTGWYRRSVISLVNLWPYHCIITYTVKCSFQDGCQVFLTTSVLRGGWPSTVISTYGSPLLKNPLPVSFNLADLTEIRKDTIATQWVTLFVKLSWGMTSLKKSAGYFKCPLLCIPQGLSKIYMFAVHCGQK